jgi:hypothetical protein
MQERQDERFSAKESFGRFPYRTKLIEENLPKDLIV